MKKFLLIAIILIFNSKCLSEESIIKTNYLELKIKKLNYKKILKDSRFASMTLVNDKIIIVTEDGFFYELDHNKKLIPAIIPSIEINVEGFKLSSTYSYKEIVPRVHDIKFIKDELYVTYDNFSNTTNQTHFIVSKLVNNEWKIVFKSVGLESPYYTMGDGGSLAFNSNLGKIYFSIGDYSLDRVNNINTDIAPQNKKNPWGKIHEYNLNNNTFSIFSLGHRNIQGLIFSKTHGLIATEHGPRGGDEINKIYKNKNYGWPYKSEGIDYGTYARVSDFIPKKNLINKNNFVDPLFSFVPDIGIKSIIEIKNFNSFWNSNFLIGSLKSESIFLTKIKNNQISFVEQIKVGYRIKSLLEYESKIFAATENQNILIFENK